MLSGACSGKRSLMEEAHLRSETTSLPPHGVKPAYEGTTVRFVRRSFQSWLTFCARIPCGRRAGFMCTQHLRNFNEAREGPHERPCKHLCAIIEGYTQKRIIQSDGMTALSDGCYTEGARNQTDQRGFWTVVARKEVLSMYTASHKGAKASSHSNFQACRKRH